MADVITRPSQNGGTGAYDALMIEEFGGLVDAAFHEMSMLAPVLNVRTVRGTNTIKNYRVGETTIKTLVAGVRPEADGTQFGDVSVTVDTVVLARNIVPLLDDIQTNYDAKVELARTQGEQLGEFFDNAGYIQAMKAARKSAPANLTGFKSGTVVSLTTADDEKDPNKLEAAILSAVKGMEEKKVRVRGSQFGTTGYDGVSIYLAPAQYYTLLQNNKLVDSQYSQGNANYAGNMLLKVAGLPIHTTTLLPQAAVTGHQLSNTANSSGYDVSANEAKGVVQLFAPRALLAGETISLTSDIFYDRVEKHWFVDSHMAFGIGPDRAEMSAIVDKA
jgi:hypothetical protein